MPKIVGSIPPCVRTLLYFYAVYRGKIPEVWKTSGARHVFIPLSYGKYFPVQNRCRPASSCVCTGISRSVLLQCTGLLGIYYMLPRVQRQLQQRCTFTIFLSIRWDRLYSITVSYIKQIKSTVSKCYRYNFLTFIFFSTSYVCPLPQAVSAVFI